MKYVIVAVVFAVVGLVQAGTLTDEQKAKIHNYSAECITSTGVDKDAVTKARNGEFSNDEKLFEYIKCMGKKTGILSESGEFQKEVALSKLPDDIDKVKAGESIDICHAKTGADKVETAHLRFQCYMAAIKEAGLL